MNKKLPLKKLEPISPEGDFGAIRKFDIHTGIDLYCSENDEVFSIEDGVVIKVKPFTGEKAGSAWWNETEYIGILSKSGYIVYGEIESLVNEGDKVSAGQKIGKVKTVLRKDKGRPMNMLHLELYTKVIDDPYIWKLNEEKKPIKWVYRETFDFFHN